MKSVAGSNFNKQHPICFRTQLFPESNKIGIFCSVIVRGHFKILAVIIILPALRLGARQETITSGIRLG